MQLQGSHSHSQIVLLWVPLPSHILSRLVESLSTDVSYSASTSAVSEGLATFEVVTKITMENADKI